MSERSVVLVAAFDDALHAHAALRRRALERLGCAVTSFDLREKPGFLGRLVGAGGDLRTRLARALEQARPDLVLVIRGAELESDVVRGLRADYGGTWVNWFPDDLRTAEAASDIALPYDRVYAAGSDVATVLAQRLGHAVDVLPLACDPSVYRPLRSRDQFRANVVFAGSATPRREALLSELVEFGLAVWGPGWRKTGLRDYCRGEEVNTDDYVRAYAGASVAVNIHHLSGDGDAPEATCNQRLFELAGIGAVQVCDARTDLPGYLVPGEDLLVYQNGAELKGMVQEALTDPALCEKMSLSGRERVLGGHTYMHRMRVLLEGQGAAAGPNA